MHQIRFRLGLHPRPCWGSSQRSPKLPSWNIGGHTSKERRGKEEGTGREGRGKKGKGREGKGRRGSPPIEISGYATDLKGKFRTANGLRGRSGVTK